MTTTFFYPEMKGTAPANAQIIAERLYSKTKLKCLNGLKLQESRSIEFQYEKEGNAVYYVTDSALAKIEKKYSVSHSYLLD